ncbi:MAG: bile acid:sodium symporter [Candidatus Nanopelagicales bacterium]
MTIEQFFEVVANISGVTFVVTSMVAMGLSLTVRMIVAPLRRWVLVLVALIANFVVVPLLAIGLAELLSLEESLRAGLLILALAAGAPFLPKLAQGANGDVAFAVGLMIVLMLLTVVLAPIALPWLLEGVSISAWAIAQSLVVLMLVPLALALAVRANWPDVASEYQPPMAKISTFAVIVLLVVALGLNINNIIDLVGTGGLLALVLFVTGSLAIGFVAGGREPRIRSVVTLGTAQRNLSAALVIATQNFSGTPTLTYVLVGAVIAQIILLLSARPIGRALGTGSPTPGTNKTI